MNAKILKHKIQEDCYGRYMSEGEIYSSSSPYLYPMSFTMESLKEYVMNIEGFEVNDNDWEVVVVKIVEV